MTWGPLTPGNDQKLAARIAVTKRFCLEKKIARKLRAISM